MAVLLGHDAALSVEDMFIDVHPVQRAAAAGRAPKRLVRQRIKKRCFARTRRPQDRKELAGSNAAGDAAEDVFGLRGTTQPMAACNAEGDVAPDQVIARPCLREVRDLGMASIRSAHHGLR